MSTMRAVYTNFRAARTALKDMARAREIAVVLVRHGFGHFVQLGNFKTKLSSLQSCKNRTLMATDYRLTNVSVLRYKSWGQHS